MTYQITEVQNKDKTRVYNIDGPQRETVESFWQWLKVNRIIENYEIVEKQKVSSIVLKYNRTMTEEEKLKRDMRDADCFYFMASASFLVTLLAGALLFLVSFQVVSNQRRFSSVGRAPLL